MNSDKILIWKNYQMLNSQIHASKFYLGFDANAGYSVKAAIRQGKKFEDLGGMGILKNQTASIIYLG